MRVAQFDEIFEDEWWDEQMSPYPTIKYLIKRGLQTDNKCFTINGLI